jgi:hypothetical protein
MFVNLWPDRYQEQPDESEVRRQIYLLLAVVNDAMMRLGQYLNYTWN